MSSKKKNDSNSQTSTNSNNTSTDPNEGINQEACEKYGITINELPIEPVEPYTRYNIDDTVYGFVTEVSHDQKGTEIEIKDWGLCLEENRIELGFQNMLRSRIMEEVIKTYGLVPVVDFTDLPDEIISWDNSIKKSKSSSSGSSGGTGESTRCPEIDDAVDKAASGKSGLERAKAIDSAFKSTIYYNKYSDCHHADDLCAAWKVGKSEGINCADGANVLCAMFIRGGFAATIYHTTNHYIVKVNVDGKDYWTDNAANSGSHTTRPFGEVYGDDPSTATECGTHLDG